MIPSAHWPMLALAGFAAGTINALAGGGTLVSFPALLALGIAPVTANITSTVALCPGYLGAALAQRRDLAGQRLRLASLLPIAACGGLSGAAWLLHTNERAFARAVPWLILLACTLLALQEKVRSVLARRQGARSYWALPLIGAGAIYGGYFGAGMSVILLAALGIVFEDSLLRLNALKQWLALAANGAAAAWLALRTPLDWPVVGVLALSAVLGGICGGRIAGRLSPAVLRRAVVLLGVAIAMVYLFRAP